MDKRKCELAAEMLEMASDHYSNHGCNDYRLPETWSQAECDDFTLEMHKWNGDPENHEPGRRDVMDWHVMSFLAAILKQQSKGET